MGGNKEAERAKNKRQASHMEKGERVNEAPLRCGGRAALSLPLGHVPAEIRVPEDGGTVVTPTDNKLGVVAHTETAHGASAGDRGGRGWLGVMELE